jgi:hypothetical protein
MRIPILEHQIEEKLPLVHWLFKMRLIVSITREKNLQLMKLRIKRITDPQVIHRLHIVATIG